MKNKLKEMKGITLIALVITIIVLLILAGVSIATLTGENGILTQATNAKNKTKEAEADEIFKLIANEWKIEKAKGTSLDAFLEEKEEEYGITATADGEDYILEYNGEKIKIDSNGNLTKVSGEEAVTLEAGLYAEDGTMVASWDELTNTYGLDIETDYTTSTYNTGNSMYYVLNNNDELSSGTKLVISDNVASIGQLAFFLCESLTSVDLGNGVETIGFGAFAATGLTSVTISDSVTSIGDSSFASCTGLISVSLGDGVESIGTNSFYNCISLSSITVPNSVTSIGNKAFEGCTGLASVTISDSVTSIEDSSFASCTGLTSITIPDGVTSIGSSAFEGCTGLASVDLGNGVESIGSEAFQYCTGLTSITIPDSVTSIASLAFEGCTGLISITIPDSVTSIGYGAFRYCTGLTSIYIPENVTKISASNFTFSLFYNCSSSLKIYCGASEAQSGWGTYWNYYASGKTLEVTYGVTLAEYEALIAE